MPTKHIGDGTDEYLVGIGWGGDKGIRGGGVKGMRGKNRMRGGNKGG